MTARGITTALTAAAVCVALAANGSAAAELPRADERFASGQTNSSQVNEVPDFRKHVVPLLGKVGCNGRSCHGSFQGQGGFRLSLFGYDFKTDHENLTGGAQPRVDLQNPEESLIVRKPTFAVPHEGGNVIEEGTWQYHLLTDWIRGGAPNVAADAPAFVRLEVTPSEILFGASGETAQLRAVAVWSDGSTEDVTPLCRFQSNSDEVAVIDESGLVTAADPGDTHVVVFYDNGVVPVPVIRPVSDRVGSQYPDAPTPTRVDELVVEKLRKLGIIQSDTCTDAEFLRRVSLDITGTLPAPAEIEAFLADSSPDKRSRKIDELLERPAYAAWWTTKLCDLTGNNNDLLVNLTPIGGRPGQDWYDWIYKRVAENVPYDQIMEGFVLARSRQPGESYKDFTETMSAIYRNEASFADRDGVPFYWARRNFRQPDERAIGFAYTFLGIRIECAQCHKHPFDQWTQDDFNAFTTFFRSVNYGQSPDSRNERERMLKALGLADQRLNGNQLQRELSRHLARGENVPFQELVVGQGGGGRRGRGNRGGSDTTAQVLGGPEVDLSGYRDPRQPLMDWLRAVDNPYFARAFVNRVWAAYFNVGIVNPTDDMSLANPPSNQALLDYLAEGFVNSGYDMKWLHREITNSRTYQLSWVTNDTNRLDERNFSRAVPRRLPAEVTWDVVRQATAATAVNAAMADNLNDRAIALASTGRRNQRGGNDSYAMMIFGRSVRESNCDCDRSAEPSLLQTVFLHNDNDVLNLLERNDSWISEIARQTGATADGGRDEALRTRLERMEVRLAELRRNGRREQAANLRRQVAVMRRQLEQREQKPAAAVSRPVRNVDELVREAYLRTLSRYPGEEELAASRQFVEGSESVVEGARGLMWALLNTKEFIVNH